MGWRFLSKLIFWGILQQDAFDKVDCASPIERQEYMLNIVIDICDKEYNFSGFAEVGPYFKKVINVLKQMNYALFKSDDFFKEEKELEKLLAESQVAVEA